MAACFPQGGLVSGFVSGSSKLSTCRARFLTIDPSGSSGRWHLARADTAGSCRQQTDEAAMQVSGRAAQARQVQICTGLPVVALKLPLWLPRNQAPVDFTPYGIVHGVQTRASPGNALRLGMLTVAMAAAILAALPLLDWKPVHRVVVLQHHMGSLAKPCPFQRRLLATLIHVCCSLAGPTPRRDSMPEQHLSLPPRLP